MYRVELEISIAMPKGDIQDDEVVDMIEVLAQAVFRNARMDVANHQIACRTNPYFISDMAGKYELTVVPKELEL